MRQQHGVGLTVRLAVGLLLTLVLAAPARGADVLDELKTRFNADRGSLRLVVLVSPTCPACVSGAGWIRDYVLARYPTLDIKVYAVWYEMYPGDSPDDFLPAQQWLADRRVTHYWDDSKAVGSWYYGRVPTTTKGEIEWDAFYLYGPNAGWTDEPSAMLTWGRTILQDRRKLTTAVAASAGPPATTLPPTLAMPLGGQP